MKKNLLSNYHHHDPFIGELSKKEDKEECEYFVPDPEPSLKERKNLGWASHNVHYTQVKEEPYAYVPALDRTPPSFYASNFDHNIPFFEPDVEPVVDYRGFQAYSPHPTCTKQNSYSHQNFENQRGSKEEEVVVVDLKKEQIINSNFTPFSSSGNFILDSVVHKNVATAFPAAPVQMEGLLTRLKYEISSYFQNHILPVFDVTLNKKLQLILKKALSFENKSLEETSQFYCRDVSKDYSVVKASFWMVAILILLWGIPDYGAILAPLVAGYVGGRKAGNEFRAFLAALLPTVASTLLLLLFTTNLIPFNSYHHVVVTFHDTFFDIISHLSVYESSHKDPSNAVTTITTTSTATFFSMLAFALIGGTMERDMRKFKKDLEIYKKEKKSSTPKGVGEKRDEKL